MFLLKREMDLTALRGGRHYFVSRVVPVNVSCLKKRRISVEFLHNSIKKHVLFIEIFSVSNGRIASYFPKLSTRY